MVWKAPLLVLVAILYSKQHQIHLQPVFFSIVFLLDKIKYVGIGESPQITKHALLTIPLGQKYFNHTIKTIL